MTEQPQTPAAGRLPRPLSFRILVVGLVAAALAVSAALAMASSAPPTSPVSATGPGPADANGFIGLAAATQLESGNLGERPAQMAGPGRHGDRAGFRAITISAREGSSLSLRTEDGWTRTITVTSETTITKGRVAITLDDLKVGDTIAFRQARNDDGTFTVTEIRVFVPTTGGAVTAVERGSVTLKLRDGSSRTVTLTSATQYFVGQREASLADLAVGDRVIAQGTVSGETFTAISVTIRPDIVVGRVTATSAAGITIETRDGATLTLAVDASTSYRVAGAADASLDDVTVGMAIIAHGVRTSESTFTASHVGAGDRMGPGRGGPLGHRLGHGFGPGTTDRGELGPIGPDGRSTPAPETGASAG
jgi:hypothetical protein